MATRGRRVRIGIYGGTFDPIHHGHLILAREAMGRFDLERMLFVPNTLSPHKMAGCAASPETRAEMVRAAIADEPGFELEECELRRGGTSYAIDTVLYLRERFPGAQFYYVIGHDNVAKLHTWHRVEELQELARFVVLCRHDGEEAPPHLTLPRRIDISATEIRERVRRNHSIRYLLPEAVQAIIARDKLYQESPSY